MPVETPALGVNGTNAGTTGGDSSVICCGGDSFDRASARPGVCGRDINQGITVEDY